jgi:hypothetical protein
VDDAIAKYRAASEANDIEALVDILAPDAELVSPVSGRMVFRGRDDLRLLLAAVFATLAGLQWIEEIGDGSRRVVIGHARVGPFPVSEAVALDLDPDGRIVRIRPHLRPWLGLTMFALVLLPRMLPHPGVVLRALRRR